jgi:bacterial/archaeal transporter family-2 protein
MLWGAGLESAVFAASLALADLEQSGVRVGQAGLRELHRMIALYLLIALLAGALVTVQTGSNARLKDALGHPLPAVVVSSLIGIVLLAAVIAVTRTPIPSVGRAMAAPWTAWLGGALGAAYAGTVVVLARELGAATLTALVVTGQLICSVALDHYGLLGFEVHGVGAGRLAGCLLLLAGTYLIWKF